MNKYVIFNINTGSNPESKKGIEPFDVDSVKLGDITRLKEYKSATDEEQERMTSAKIKVEMAKYYKDAEKNFALYGVTGKVLVASYYNSESGSVINNYVKEGNTEKDLLVDFWNLCKFCEDEGFELVGFNSNRFDIPFLIQRSIIIGIPIHPLYDGKWTKKFVRDIYEDWMRGMKSDYTGSISNSLGAIGSIMGLGEKNQKISREFEKYFINHKELALEHCTQEIEWTKELYLRLNNFIPQIRKEDLLNEEDDR